MHQAPLHKSAKSNMDSSSVIAQELEKYKQYKSQFNFNSIPTEQSEDLSTVSPANSRFRQEERKPFQNAVFQQGFIKYISKAFGPLESRVKANQSSEVAIPEPKEALLGYSSPRDRIDSQQRALSSLETPCFGKEDSERYHTRGSKGLSKTLRNSERQNAQSSFARKGSISRGTTGSTKNVVSEKQNVMKEPKRTASVNKVETKVPAKVEATPVKEKGRPSNMRSSNVSTAEKSGRKTSPHSRTNTDSSMTNASTVSQKSLKNEIREWREFGESMAKSYEDLSGKYKQYLKEREKSKATIASLTEQLSTLRDSSFTGRNNTENNVQGSNLDSKQSFGSFESPKHDSEKLKQLEEENENVKRTLEFLQVENEAQKKTLDDAKKFQEQAQYYKTLAEEKFKECSTLAEEIICLRTDLDRSHSNFLRMKVQTNFKGGEEFLRLKKKVSSPVKSGGIKTSIKKVVKWKDEVEERLSPNPKVPKLLSQKLTRVSSKVQ